MARNIDAICAPSGYKALFVVAQDGKLWELYCGNDGEWRSHGYLPGYVKYWSSHPCVSNQNNYIGLFVLGKDGKLYERYLDPARGWIWSEPDFHGPVPGGAVYQDIAAVAVGQSNVSVFCFGRDNHLHERRFANGWQPWIDHGPLPGGVHPYAQGMAAAASSQGKISLLLKASDGRAHERFFDGRGPIGDPDSSQWRQYDPPPNNVGLRTFTCVALPSFGSLGPPSPPDWWPFWAFSWGTDQCLYQLGEEDGVRRWTNRGSPADGIGDIWDPMAVTAFNAGSIASVFVTPQHGTPFLHELRYNGEWRWIPRGPSIIGRGGHLCAMVDSTGDYLSVFTRVSDHVAECRSGVEPWTWHDHGVPPYAKPTCNIKASPNPIKQGQSSTLSWTSANAESAHITHIGNVELNGQKQVSPSSTTVYTLSARGAGGSARSEVTVNVEEPTTGTLTIDVLFDLGPGRWYVEASVRGKVINYTGTTGQTSFSDSANETFQDAFMGSIAFVMTDIVVGEWEITAKIKTNVIQDHTCPAHVPGHIEVDFRGGSPHCHTL